MKKAMACLVLAGGVVLMGQGCTSQVEDAGADGPQVSDQGVSEDDLTAGDVACTLSKVASAGTLVGAVACWVATPASGGTAVPVCVWLSSAGVTAAKIANGAAQCATGCGGGGAVCKYVVDTWNAPKIPSNARILNGGCTKLGFYGAERDVCGMGYNKFYGKDSPESRQCVEGKATGFWALSRAEQAYIRNPANCAARGFGN